MRRASIWISPVVVATAVAAFALAGVAQAGRHIAPFSKTSRVTPAVVPSHTLLKTYLVTGQSFASGQSINVDPPTTITCPAKKAPCSVEATISVELDDNAAKIGTVGRECLLVDGQLDNVGCPWFGPAPTNGGLYFTPTEQGVYSPVRRGSHTVQTVVLTPFGDGTVTAYGYTIVYRVYA
jgi:hypothetical protein